MAHTEQGVGYKAEGTSAEAAQAVGQTAAYTRTKILQHMRKAAKPMSADDVAAAINEPILSVRPRMSELRNRGLLRDSGWRGKNASGKSCILYAMVEAPQAVQA